MMSGGVKIHPTVLEMVGGGEVSDLVNCDMKVEGFV
jgi:hypothetical protein